MLPFSLYEMSLHIQCPFALPWLYCTSAFSTLLGHPSSLSILPVFVFISLPSYFPSSLFYTHNILALSVFISFLQSLSLCFTYMWCKCQHRSVVLTGYASVWFSLHQSKLAEAEHGQHALLNWWCLLGKTFGFAHKWVPDQFLVNIAQMLQSQKGLRYLRIRQFAHIFPSSCSHSVLAAYFWWNKSAISHQSFSAEQISHILNMYNSVLTRSIGPKVGFSITVLSFLLFSIVQIYLYLHKLWSTLYSLCKMKIEWLLFNFFCFFYFLWLQKRYQSQPKGFFCFVFVSKTQLSCNMWMKEN